MIASRISLALLGKAIVACVLLLLGGLLLQTSLGFEHDERLLGKAGPHSHLGHRPGSPHDNGRGSLEKLRGEQAKPLDALAAHRYETAETWRPLAAPDLVSSSNAIRLKRPGYTSYANKAEYIRQPLVADYHEDEVGKIFLMIKTGGTVFWKRVPVHVFTTLTRVKNFALYSDAPGSIAGYEVIDILANLTDKTHEHENFVAWNRQKILHDEHSFVSYDEVPSKTDSGIARNTGWHLDKYKNIPMLHHAWNMAPELDWYVYIDGDTHIFVDSLVRLLKNRNPDEHCYMGNLRRYTSRLHDETIGFAQGGSGVILSKKTMREVGTHPDWIPKYEEITHGERGGDDMVAIMLKDELGVEVEHKLGFHEENIRNTNFRPESWCEPIVTLHHILPQDVETYWEYETLKRLANEPIYHSSLYRDFIMPYIGEKIENWDNFIAGDTVERSRDEKDGVKPKSEGGPESRPYESPELCQQWCLEDNNCLNWNHRSGPNSRCAKARNIKIGKRTHPWQTSSSETEKHTSGWIIERIRTMRNNTQCDDINDGPGEGWALPLIRS